MSRFSERLVQLKNPPYLHGRALLFLFLVHLFALSGCAPVVEERQRYFWPPGIERPRIEYINYYWSEQDAKRGTGNPFAEAVLGKEQPKPFFLQPRAIASDGNGRIFISDLGFNKVFVFDLARHEVRSLRATQDKVQPFVTPMGLAVDDTGRVYVSDAEMRKIFVFGPDEKLETHFGAEKVLQRPTGIAVDPERDHLHVVDTGTHRVVTFDFDGTVIRTFGGRGHDEGEFNFPTAVDVDEEGNIYILDTMNARVQVFGPDGTFVRTFGERGTASGSFQIPKDLAVSPSGHVYVTDSQAHRFVVFDLEGNYLVTVGGRSSVRKGGLSPGGFYMLIGIDVDSNDTIWVVDSLNRMFHQLQYLTDDYLEENPILPGQTYLPPGFFRNSDEDGRK